MLKAMQNKLKGNQRRGVEYNLPPGKINYYQSNCFSHVTVYYYDYPTQVPQEYLNFQREFKFSNLFAMEVKVGID